MEKKPISRNNIRIQASAIILALFMTLTAFTTMTHNPVRAEGDITPPIQTLEFGAPKLPITWHSNNYYIISPYTTIWINSSDEESGSDRIQYSVWLADDINANPLQWRHLEQYDRTVYDEDEDGFISAEFTLQETCFHEIRYQCWDKEGNTAGLYSEDVFVDASAPVTTKTVGCPEYGVGEIQPPWANYRTPIIFHSVDESCFPGGTGVNSIILKIWWKPDTCTDEGALQLVDTITIIDQDMYDTDPAEGVISYEYHLLVTGFYELEWYGTDIFGNEEIAWKQQHRVDNESPNIDIEYPTHGYMRIGEDEGYLKCNLPFSMTAYDMPISTCNVGFDQLYWRYEYDWQLYPAPGEDGAINGADIAAQYCFTDPEIENYWWYIDNADNIMFTEECRHDMYYFATDNLGNYHLNHHVFYVDNTEPYVEVTYPDHGYYPGVEDHLKVNIPITLNAYDNPANYCQSGIESLFYRYEWNTNYYPDGPSEGVISGVDLALMYGEDYNIPDITDYYWYRINDATVDIQFPEQCMHDLYLFAKDNVCHRSEIYHLIFYVDAETPYATVTYPEHGYYEDDYRYLKANTPITVNAYDRPDNLCGSGIESIFWNYGWNQIYYPTGPGDGIVSGQQLVDWYGSDYDIPEITEYYWYYVDAATVDIAFTEECTHILRFFVKDNVCQRSEIYELDLHVDNSSPMVEIRTPQEHGYYNNHVRPNLPFTISAYDLPDNECAAGIEALFYRIVYDGMMYPDEPGEGIISGQDLVVLYGEDYNIPEITEYYWYYIEDNMVELSFTEECEHQFYFFAKDNLCHRGEIYHESVYVDDSPPTVELQLPTHGYYEIDTNEGYLKDNTPVTIIGTDHPDNECAAGIETVFYRYEWDGEYYPNEPGMGVIHGEDLASMYGPDYEIPEIVQYFWYYVDSESAQVSFNEQCEHDLYYFVKDNVCHRSDIFSCVFHVDDGTPGIYSWVPEEHGYYYDDNLHVRCGNPITLYTYDLPENDCMAGVESLFWRYEWESGYYPSGPGDGVVSGQDLVTLYGDDYNIPDITDYYWYRVDDTSTVITLTEECDHDIYYFVKDNVCHRSEITHEIWCVDCSGPEITIEYPDHGYVPSTDTSGYLKVDTPVTLTAVDYPDGICASGVEALFYRYEWNGNFYPDAPGDWVISGQEIVDLYGEEYNTPEIQPYYWYWVYGDSTELFFEEECQHELYAFAKDNLCNHGDVYHHTFYVDASLPMITLEHGWEGFLSHGEQDYLRCDCPIWINATDDGMCQAGVESIFYRYLWNDTFYPDEPGQGIVHGQDLVSMYGETYNIPDISDYYWYRVDADSVTLFFTEDCTHDLYYFGKDNVCQHSDVYSYEFNVDCTPPVIIKEVGEPSCVVVEGEEYCVTTDTSILIDAYDEGCCGDLLLTVEYKINDGDWVPIMEPTRLYFTEECDHTLTIRATDCLGNTAEDVELFHVDDTPPMIIKTVGDPNIVIVEGEEYCVSQQTEITVEAVDQGCCCVQDVTIEYRIWYDEVWTDWMPYEEPITFSEDCTHILEVRASDCLGNTAYDQETFNVDSIPPNLIKTVGYPSVWLGYDWAGHDQWMIYPYTPISFTAEDQGCCPCPESTIYYRYWYLGHWTDWMIYDHPITLTHGCVHYLEAYAMDCLGNSGEVDNETFWVCGPGGDTGPDIVIEYPTNGSVYCERTLEVIINASDDDTPTEDLILKLWMPGGRRNAPTLWYEPVYDPEDGFFHAYIDIFEYQNGAQLTLEAFAQDQDMNVEFAIPVTFTVCSNTGYDQWMQEGWNSLTIPYGEIACSPLVEDVLGSIYGNYEWVWYYDVVHDDWSSWYKYRDPEFNSLAMMDPGKQYWVYMEMADRFYTDTTPPMVMIDSPVDESILNMLSEVSGTAYDGETGLKDVSLMITDMNTGLCWDGDSWEAAIFYLPCVGTETWSYDAEMVAWINGHTYELTAMATDMVGCQTTDTVSFLWDANPPVIIILDPMDGEERLDGPDSMNFEVYDLETSVSSVWVEIYDETTMLFYDGMTWQGNQTWLPVMYDYDDFYYYDSNGIWPMEVPRTYDVTVKAYDIVGNMGMETSTFTIIQPQQECNADRTYTTDADFDEGILTGVEHETVHNQLQMIPGEITTFPTMWIANAGEDSLSKWDTHENIELARYHTWFGPLSQHDAWSGAAPSRTCVDSEGNCYVANRHFDYYPADVIKVYTTNWIDRNGDGNLNTSWDVNGNGVIEPEEMLPMTDTNGNGIIDDNEIVDERIAWVVTVGDPGGLGRSLAIDLEGNIWVGLYNSYVYYKISSEDGSILGGPYYVGMTPYGALVDRYGYLWSSSLGSTLLKLNTNNPTEYTNYYVPSTYGIALGYDSLGNTLVYCGGNSPYVVFNSSTESYTYAPNSLFYCLGIATDSKGNIVAGSSGDGSVGKFAPNGDVLWYVPGQVVSEVRGIAVDSEDNVWAIHRDLSKLCKYNGTDGAYMGVYDSGYQPYTYSDATGLGYATSVSVGTWNVVHDSYAADTEWERISWTSDEPEGSQLTVKVRSSTDQMSWSPWEVATNGNTLSSTPPGRYLNILTTFEKDPLGQSPILYDLTVDGTCAGIVEIPHVSMQKQVWVPEGNSENGGGDLIPLDASNEFVTYVYTVENLILFGYTDDTNLTIYNTADLVIWMGTLNMGEHHVEDVIAGVYKVVGDKKFSILTGDPLVDLVGYYALDENGYGLSTLLYTFMPDDFGGDYDDKFIVFSYTDDTEVTITNMDSMTVVWSGTLNKGEHYTDTTLNYNYVKVESNYPVSALSYNDQGYFVPSANKKLSGTEFYTFADDLGDWPNTLHVMAFEDNTVVTIKNTDTDVEIWSGTLNAGEEHEYTTYSNIYLTILTDKDVTVGVLPIDGYSSGYYHGNYVPDKTGSGIGTEFYTPCVDGGELYVFAYQDGITVQVYDPETDTLMGTYNLDTGDYADVNPGYGYWHILSNGLVSVYEGYGAAAADFAPVLFGEAVSSGYWGEERDATLGDIVRFKITAVNDGQCDFMSGELRDYLPNSLQYVEGSTNITFKYDGETYYPVGDIEPWEFPGPDNMMLLWNSSSGFEGNYPPGMIAIFEFEAEVVDCAEPVAVNMVNISVEPACGDTLYAEDTADVNIICEEPSCNADRTYTTDADFSEGTFVGGVYAENDQLQLTPGEGTTYPVMWIANSGESSVSKWDTNQNKELARYKTFFYGGSSHSGPAPSRTCVDPDGNCYVANRQFYNDKSPDVLKILANDYIDRNGNGIMDTSYDANDDGVIDPSEMMPLIDTNMNNKIDPEEIQDERIAWAVEVGPENGLGRSLAIDLDGNIWLGCYNTNEYYKISGVDGSPLVGPVDVGWHTPYGALVDKNGILWGSSLSNNLLEFDTNTLSLTLHDTPGLIYGIALGYDSQQNTLVYMGARYGDTFYVYNTSSNLFDDPAALRYDVFGVATDQDGNIFAGDGSYGQMVKYRPDGSVIWQAPAQLATHIRGTVVDSNGDVWAIHLSDDKMCKYDGENGEPLGIFNTGSDPYTYSDATGIGYSSSVVTGKWTVVHDSLAPGTIWDMISWNSLEPEGSSVSVKVRSSEDQLSWSPWEDAENMMVLQSTPAGQYIEIEVTLKTTSGDVSPILYDLTVEGTCSGQPSQGSISGTIFNGGSGYGPVVVYLSDTMPPETILDTVILDSSALPAPYMFDNLDTGTYYVGAFLDMSGNYEYDAYEPLGYAINHTWYADALMVMGTDVTDADVTLVDPTPSIQFWKTVWDGEVWADGDPEPIVDVNVGDIVFYNVTGYNDGNVILTGAELTDILPAGLSYRESSTTILVVFENGTRWYYDASDPESQPDITFNPDGTTTLHWEYFKTKPLTPCHAYIEYHALVLECDETPYVNNVVGDAYYYDTHLHGEDDAWVQAFCEETHMISGTVYYEGVPNGQLVIAYAEESSGEDPLPGAIVPDPVFPYSYIINDVADGTYDVFAFLDFESDMGPPESDEPIGNAINNTVAEGFDPIVVSGADATGVDITLHEPELPTCIVFEACVDGSDWITIENYQLSIEHRNWGPIGGPDCNCNDFPDHCSGKIYVDGIEHIVELQPDDTYTIDGEPYLTVGIGELYWFEKLEGRGSVTWDGDHKILIDDDALPEFPGADIYFIQLCIQEPPVSPIVDITYPEDDDWFNYSMAGALTITGIAYDQDTYVDSVDVTLSYTDDYADTYYYNMSGWHLTPTIFTVGGTGAGTMGDPLMWELIVEPAFPIEYYLYDVYATVYDHDAVPLMNSDANWFWYPEVPVEVYHGQNLRTGEEFVTIQEAIDDPDTMDGDTIVFEPGTYMENVNVTKSLSIQSLSGNPEDTIVQSIVENGSVFHVQADEVTIQGFTCTGATGWWLGAGILLDSVDDCTIKNNILTGNNVIGILSISYSDNNIIEGNNVSDNEGTGIIVDHSEGNTLQGNIIQGNNQGKGVFFYHSDHNILEGNTIQNNTDDGIMLWIAGYNTILGNTVKNNGRGIGTYFDTSHGNLIYNNYFDNTYNADDDYDNAWNITPILGTNIIGGDWLAGNYWSDYLGVDANGDGLGDTPYLIEGFVNQDNHPLFNPLENHPPNIPTIVSPLDGATDVSVDTFLTWTCTDQDSGDILHYTVCFDYAYPPAIHAINVLDTTYDPGTIDYNQLYYWQIVAFDDHGKSTEGPIWSFTTAE
ncbi:MAG: NosD domain-containing protein [Methanobacteriota archaeon]